MLFTSAKLKGIDMIPLELIAQVYNINCGHNPEILKRCETLANYSKFVDKLQEFQKKGIKLEESIRPVIEYCIKNNIMKKYLQEHGSEVFNMIFGEYDRDMDIAVNRREAREEAQEEDKQYFLELINQGLTIKEIKERLNQKEIFTHS